MGFNIYQIIINKKLTDNDSVKVNNPDLEYLSKKYPLNEIINNKKFKINTDLLNGNQVELIIIFPIESCEACINYDSDLVKSILKQNKYSVHSFFLLNKRTDYKYSRINDLGINFTHVNNYESLWERLPSTFPKLDNPTYLVVNKMGFIISAHISNIFEPERTRLFLENVAIIL